MTIRKFRGESFKEAIELIRAEMGSEAIILSSKDIRPNIVEVTAAAEYKSPRRTTRDLSLLLTGLVSGMLGYYLLSTHNRKP